MKVDAKVYKYGIVVVGYKNLNGMQRLLNALDKADYSGENISLIISIDKSDEDSVIQYAINFNWKHGEKFVRTFEERQGLRKHVLICGNYLNEYDFNAIAVFEDDIMPSKYFYEFMKQSVIKYYDNMDIAGISLYTHCLNVNVNKVFSPLKVKEDNYFLQFAQSWGQIWMRKQWNKFMDWYLENKNWDIKDYSIPLQVLNWPDNSWLKYHIKYCIKQKKYFVYPYIAYSTCFSDVGEHVKTSTDIFQVQLDINKYEQTNLSDFNEHSLKYNAFFENEAMYQYCNVPQDELLVDLYGSYPLINCRYLLTIRYLPFKIIKSWGNRLIPHEMNIIYDISGHDIFLYDIGEEQLEKELPVQKLNPDKFEDFYYILDKWMFMKEDKKSIDLFFTKYGIKTIAIYGWRSLGRHLYHDLLSTDISVVCAIDNNVGEETRLKLINENEDIPNVDAIIVTATFDFYKIKYDLEKRYKGKILSLKDIIS